MSAKVIPLNNRKKEIRKLIDQTVDANLSHKNPQVLSCLKSEIETLVDKHFSGTAPEIVLPLPRDLTDVQFRQIKGNLQRAFTDHNERMVRHSNAIFLDLYLSRLEVCELKYGDPQSD